ncbi:hypothetical protein [Yersinia enterocolitica]
MIERKLRAAADGRIVKNISDNIVDIERIKSVEQKVPNKKDNNDSNVSSAGHKQDWLTRVFNKIFFDSNISGKEDKKMSSILNKVLILLIE